MLLSLCWLFVLASAYKLERLETYEEGVDAFTVNGQDCKSPVTAPGLGGSQYAFISHGPSDCCFGQPFADQEYVISKVTWDTNDEACGMSFEEKGKVFLTIPNHCDVEIDWVGNLAHACNQVYQFDSHPHSRVDRVNQECRQGCVFDNVRYYSGSKPTPSPTYPPTPPSLAPTPLPTLSPTARPTFAPTPQPTMTPSLAPTPSPTRTPTFAPTFNRTVHDDLQALDSNRAGLRALVIVASLVAVCSLSLCLSACYNKRRFSARLERAEQKEREAQHVQQLELQVQQLQQQLELAALQSNIATAPPSYMHEHETKL